jgi:hypothetical protein
MDEWKLPWEGGCRCNAVRVRVTKPPLLSGACHCSGCQKMSASAYSLTLSIPSDGFEVTGGDPVEGGLGGPVSHHFHCPRCKSWVFTRAEGFDWFVNLRATMLDDHGWYAPFVELWTREKLPWAATSAPHSYESVPEMAEFETLMRAYAAEGARPGRPE